jgi:hypothetical protein
MSTLKTNKITTTAGVEVYTAKAWVNFNGTGAVAIRAAGNVSSITDNGTGDYTVNFTTAMVDVNYTTVTASGGGTTTNPVALSVAYPLTTSVSFQSHQGANSGFDQAFAYAAIFR